MGTSVVMAVVAGEPVVLPSRVEEAARRGVRLALSGSPSAIANRLWAYEIEQAANHLLDRYGLSDRISVHTNGETVSFAPRAR
jgi:hypothetical protein